MATKKSAPAPTKKSAPKTETKAPTKKSAPSTDELEALAKDLNHVMGLNPPIDPELTDEEIIEAIKAVGDDISKDDELAASSWGTLALLGVGPAREAGEEPAEKLTKAEKKAAKDAKPKSEKKKSDGSGLKGPGIIKEIRDYATANCKKGFTRLALHEHLVAKFPDRDADAMKKTINVQVPSRVNKEVEGMNLVKQDGGEYKQVAK